MLNDKEDTAAVVTVISPQKGHVQNTISMRAFKLSFVLRIVVNLIKKNNPHSSPPLYCGSHELVIGYDHLLLPFRSRHPSTRQRGWSLRSHNPDNFYQAREELVEAHNLSLDRDIVAWLLRSLCQETELERFLASAEHPRLLCLGARARTSSNIPVSPY